MASTVVPGRSKHMEDPLEPCRTATLQILASQVGQFQRRVKSYPGVFFIGSGPGVLTFKLCPANLKTDQPLEKLLSN